MTMAGKWRLWEEGWREPEKEKLKVVGLGLRRAKLWFPRGQDEIGARGRGSYSTEKRVRFTFEPEVAGNRTARASTARVFSAEEVKQLKAGPARTGMGWDPRCCWVAPKPFEHKTEKLRALSSQRSRIFVSQSLDTSSLAVSLSEPQDLGDELSDSFRK